MKNYIILLLFTVFFNCKTNKKETVSVDLEKKIETQLEQDKALRLKLKGKIYSSIKEIEELKSYYDSGGYVVGKFNGQTYVISIIEEVEGASSYVIFEESLSSKERKFKILDILDLRKEKILKNIKYNLFNHFCYKDGKPDEEIIAIAKKEEDEEYLTEIYKAWRADCKTQKIIEIPVKGIKVENIGYGI